MYMGAAENCTENLQPKMGGLSFKNKAACRVLNSLCSELLADWWFIFPSSPEQEEKRETQKTRQSSIDY